MRDPHAVLAGELGLIGLFDLAQLLQLNGATGVLSVSHDGRKGYLYFVGGQIVNAVDDEYHEGEGAAYRMFAWKQGAFEFRHEPGNGARTITDSTEGLMLEAARRIDEAGLREDGVSATEQLHAHGGKFEALREVFQNVAREAGTKASPLLRGEDGPPQQRLRQEGDALVYRPGHAPRIKTRGQWRTLEGAPLDSAAYDQLKARLLEGVWPPLGPGDRTAQTRSTTLEDGRRASVTILPAPNETLWLRPAGLEPDSSEQWDGPLDGLLELLAMPHGLVLVSGPDAASADRMLHAVVALLVQHRPATLLLVGNTHRWEHREENGLLLRSSAEESLALLEVLSPEVAAFDTASGAHSLAALHAVPLVFAAVIANAPGCALGRWLARHDKRAAQASAILAGLAIGVVHAPLAQTHDTLRFRTVRLQADGCVASDEALPIGPELASDANPAELPRQPLRKSA